MSPKRVQWRPNKALDANCFHAISAGPRSLEIHFAAPNRDNFLIEIVAARLASDESDRTIREREFL